MQLGKRPSLPIHLLQPKPIPSTQTHGTNYKTNIQLQQSAITQAPHTRTQTQTNICEIEAASTATANEHPIVHMKKEDLDNETVESVTTKETTEEEARSNVQEQIRLLEQRYKNY